MRKMPYTGRELSLIHISWRTTSLLCHWVISTPAMRTPWLARRRLLICCAMSWVCLLYTSRKTARELWQNRTEKKRR